MARLGIANASHHTLRHTGASSMLADGISVRVVQEIGGWTSLRMLERYTHPTDAETRRAVESLGTLRPALLRSGLGTEALMALQLPRLNLRSRTRHRVFPIAEVALVLLAFVVACGSGEEAPGEDFDPRPVIRQAVDQLLALESAAFTLEHFYHHSTRALIGGLFHGV